jgi:acyl-CoA hydrolase
MMKITTRVLYARIFSHSVVNGVAIELIASTIHTLKSSVTVRCNVYDL